MKYLHVLIFIGLLLPLQADATNKGPVDLVLVKYDLDKGIYEYGLVNHSDKSIKMLSLGNGMKPSLKDFRIQVTGSPSGWSGRMQPMFESIYFVIQWWAEDGMAYVQPGKVKRGFAITVPIIEKSENPRVYMDGSPMFPHHPEKFPFIVLFEDGNRFYGYVTSDVVDKETKQVGP
ncbi:MAG: hypothetical protein D6698_14075 [Gammaproteobacteria bacterium]|nr:MAG: hypothetical protein D6698_14075 [Gammaproteobacteria bacterium]